MDAIKTDKIEFFGGGPLDGDELQIPDPGHRIKTMAGLPAASLLAPSEALPRALASLSVHVYMRWQRRPEGGWLYRYVGAEA